MTGKVKFFDSKRGFGFITRDDDAHDVFVHITGLADGQYKTLDADDRVEFEIGKADKGPIAQNVRRVEG